MNEVTTLSTLAVIAEKINYFNEQADICANQAVIFAAKSGEQYLLGKSQCNHGDFEGWVSKNVTKPYSTAQKYMRIAKNHPELLNSNSPTSAILPSISQVIELLNAPDEVKTEVTAKIEAGEDVTIKEIQRLKQEAADLKTKNDALQTDLITKTQRLDDAEAKVRFQKLTVDAVEKQNDDFRKLIDVKVSQGISEANAQLIIENKDAIAQAKRERDNAFGELDRLKREQDKAIKDGVTRELNQLETQISQKRYQFERIEREFKELQKVKEELDDEVGVLAIHKTAIKEIKTHLSFLTTSFADAFDTSTIPNEPFSDWQAISEAVSKINKQLLEFLTDFSPLESTAIEVF